MTESRPDVSVVVPTRDRPSSLARCLAALEAQTASSFEVVVVDDGSTDASGVDAVIAGAPHARIVRADGRGPAAARNRGIDASVASIVCLTDDDCEPVPHWVDRHRDRIDRGADVVAGPTVNGPEDRIFSRASQLVTNHLVAESSDYAGGVRFAPTSNLAARSAVFEEHRFDESYPAAAGEDREWCAQVVDAGLRIVVEDGAVVDHHQDLSFRRFWRQQVRYGRGAVGVHHSGADERRPLSFYAGLVRVGFADGLATGVAVVIGQLATVTGFAIEMVDRRRRRGR